MIVYSLVGHMHTLQRVVYENYLDPVDPYWRPEMADDLAITIALGFAICLIIGIEGLK